jgi:hypothetical protein
VVVLVVIGTSSSSSSECDSFAGSDEKAVALESTAYVVTVILALVVS